MTSDSHEIVDALEVLEDVLVWDHLSADGWRDVAEVLEAMVAALPAAPPALTAKLELISSLRVPRAGERKAEQPPPPPIRERVNELIHAHTRTGK